MVFTSLPDKGHSKDAMVHVHFRSKMYTLYFLLQPLRLKMNISCWDKQRSLLSKCWPLRIQNTGLFKVAILVITCRLFSTRNTIIKCKNVYQNNAQSYL